MPFTRKRKGSNDSKLADDSLSKKLKTNINYNPQDICQDLYDFIRNLRNEDGKLVCEPFIRAPKKRSDPEYYATVTNPMDLIRIQHKIKSEEYEDVEEMQVDFLLLFNNAKAFYSPQSSEYKQAVSLWDLFSKAKARLVAQALGDESIEPISLEDFEEIDEDDNTEEVFNGTKKDGCTPIISHADEEDDCEDKDIELTEGQDGDKKEINPHKKVPVLKLKVGTNYSEPPNTSGANQMNMDTSSSTAPLNYDESSRSQSCFSASEADDNNTEVKPLSLEASAEMRKKRKYVRKKFAAPLLSDTDGKPVAVPSEDYKKLNELMFAVIVNASDETHMISEMFKILPSKTKFPEYYQIIKEPIDLRTIARKIQSSTYSSFDGLIKDLMLMVQNAKTFNAPGSQIYKDAAALKKLIILKKSELEQGKPQTPYPARPTQQRMRGRPPLHQGPVVFSAIIAALHADSDDDIAALNSSNKNVTSNGAGKGTETETTRSEGEYSDGDGADNEYWQLFRAVLNHRNQQDALRLSEPFLRLPNRRVYPDYYMEIKKPISFTKIKKKIKAGSYNDLDKIASDFNLVFENAKQYNMEDSQIYKDAVTLQKLMKSKKQELKAKLLEQKETSIKQEDPLQSNSLLYNQSFTARSPSAGSSFGMGGTGSGSESIKRKKHKIGPLDEATKNNLTIIYRIIYEYQVGSRPLINMFITLPLKKDFPDYYKVISKPIDMTMIVNKIKLDAYPNVLALATDLKLMFNNACTFNEEQSQIYKDAEILEKVLNSKLASMQPITNSHALPTPNRTNYRSTPSKYKILYEAIRDYTDMTGRNISTPFMKLPSRLEHPEYYKIVKNPMDLQKIAEKLMSDQYHNLDQITKDYMLVFDNACIYHPPESIIYKDALTLHRVCLEKVCELMLGEENQAPDVQLFIKHTISTLQIALMTHQDEDGRCYMDSLAEISFNNLTNMNEEIKNIFGFVPSMDTLSARVQTGLYRRLDSFQLDLFEIFDIVRKSSPVDSQIYEDAVSLQLFYLCKRDDLCKGGQVYSSPALYFTHSHLHLIVQQENKERPPLISKEDSNNDDDEDDEDEKQKEKIAKNKNNINFITEKSIRVANQLEINEDAIATKNIEAAMALDNASGDSLVTKILEVALSIENNEDAIATKNIEIAMAMDTINEDAMSTKNIEDAMALDSINEEGIIAKNIDISLKEDKQNDITFGRISGAILKSLEYEGRHYEKGDYVYIQPRVKGLSTHILCIENMFIREDAKEYWFYGRCFLRPSETYHTVSKKFIDKEVFKSDFYDNIPMSMIIDKCYVMYVKDYMKMQPQGFASDDVYVCESRYYSKLKTFKKIKIWHQSQKKNQVTLFNRPQPIILIRRVMQLNSSELAIVMPNKSVSDQLSCEFKANTNPTFIESNQSIIGRSNGFGFGMSGSSMEVSLLEKLRRPIVKDITNKNVLEGCLYYEQFHTPYSWIKLGDAIQVRNIKESDETTIVLIESIWTNMSQVSFVSGPCFLTPRQIDSLLRTSEMPIQLYYKKELFMSLKIMTIEVSQIIKRCSVMNYRDYIICRLGEIPEQDVYICENKFIEIDRSITKFIKPLKNSILSSNCCDDELIFFRKPLLPLKESLAQPTPIKSGMEDSLMNSSNNNLISQQIQHIISDVRNVEEDSMDFSTSLLMNKSFTGDLSQSRIGGIQSCLLESDQALTVGDQIFTPNNKKRRKGIHHKVQKGRNITGYIVYAGECRKDIQLEFPEFNFGEISKTVGHRWKALAKDEREKYEEKARILAANAKQADALALAAAQYPIVQSPGPDSRSLSPNGGISGVTSQASGISLFSSSSTSLNNNTFSYNINNNLSSSSQNMTNANPLFVSLPPMSQRVVHSETYLRYIENLTNGNRLLGEFDKCLKARKPEVAKPFEYVKKHQLPLHWLEQGSIDHHGDVVTALWSLRELMLKDSLTYNRLEF